MSYYCGQSKKPCSDDLDVPDTSDNILKKQTDSTKMNSGSSKGSSLPATQEQLPHLPDYSPLKVYPCKNPHHKETKLCPFCKKSYLTKSRKTIGCAAKSWGAVLCLFTGVLCWIPCVLEDCKDQEIVCANCAEVREKVPSSYFC